MFLYSNAIIVTLFLLYTSIIELDEHDNVVLIKNCGGKILTHSLLHNKSSNWIIFKNWSNVWMMLVSP